MSRPPELDSFGELYRGFDRDRKVLKKRVPKAEDVWRKAFELMRGTEEFYQRSDEDVARETMRVLMASIKGAKRGRSAGGRPGKPPPR